MRWAENEESGWCNKHVEAYLNIAGPVLGVPKAVSACLSGSPPLLYATSPIPSHSSVEISHILPHFQEPAVMSHLYQGMCLQAGRKHLSIFLTQAMLQNCTRLMPSEYVL